MKQEIAHSRVVVARELRGLAYEADLGAKLKRSFRSNTAMYLGAAALLGLAFTFIPRKKKVVVDAKNGHERPGSKLLESGLVLGALKLAVNLGRPVLMKYIQQRMHGGGKPGRKF